MNVCVCVFSANCDGRAQSTIAWARSSSAVCLHVMIVDREVVLGSMAVGTLLILTIRECTFMRPLSTGPDTEIIIGNQQCCRVHLNYSGGEIVLSTRVS